MDMERRGTGLRMIVVLALIVLCVAAGYMQIQARPVEVAATVTQVPPAGYVSETFANGAMDRLVDLSKASYVTIAGIQAVHGTASIAQSLSWSCSLLAILGIAIVVYLILNRRTHEQSRAD